MSIAVDDLSFSYDGEHPVLENIQISISSGEFIGIFGPNGGGKTTFLKLLLGLLKPDRGSISIDRKHVGYVPQLARFDRQFPISVLEVVLMGCLAESEWWGGIPATSKKKSREAIARLGLEGKENKAFGTLSGGEAQRALIARAIVTDPQILLLDEPTASVDLAAEQEIYQILNALKGKMTILMVTHDLQAIVHKAGRLICIHRQATSFLPSEVCEHFALGLYHPPLLRPR